MYIPVRKTMQFLTATYNLDLDQNQATHCLFLYQVIQMQIRVGVLMCTAMPYLPSDDVIFGFALLHIGRHMRVFVSVHV